MGKLRAVVGEHNLAVVGDGEMYFEVVQILEVITFRDESNLTQYMICVGR